MNTPLVGALRIAVIAEGTGDGSSGSMPPEPGYELWDDLLGPAHVLVRRLIAEVTPAAVSFVQPLRTKTGRVAAGSDLLHQKTLRQLLTWFGAEKAPHVTIVLVDRDGDASRAALLATHLEGVPHSHVIGIAVEAFEAWLATNEPAPEAVPASEIKQRVSRDRDQRIATATTLDLQKQMARCPSLADLHEKLKEIVPGLLAGR